jgi:glycosyltransferase involved in cell wall biosynthesis
MSLSTPRVLALLGGAALFGQERGNIEALAALKDQGCDVLCLVRNDWWAIHLPPVLDANGLRWEKMPYIEHWTPSPWVSFVFRNMIAWFAANWKFFLIVRRFRPTHIHVCSHIYFLNVLPVILFLPYPVIFRAGDEPTIHRLLWRVLWRIVAWRTSRFVANSRFVARSLHSAGVGEERITLIYNAPPRRKKLGKLKLKLPDGSRAFVFIGQLSEHKGIHILVEAFLNLASSFPAAYLLIAGRISEWKGDDWARSLRNRVVTDSGMRERVLFLGEIDDVYSLLALSEAHIAPSLFNDPSPNVVMEAKQAGRPSIVFPRGGLVELVNNGVDGAVCSAATATALTEALRLYLENPTLARNQGLAALASLNKFEVPQFAQKWLDVYTSTGI